MSDQTGAHVYGADDYTALTVPSEEFDRYLRAKEIRCPHCKNQFLEGLSYLLPPTFTLDQAPPLEQLRRAVITKLPQASEYLVAALGDVLTFSAVCVKCGHLEYFLRGLVMEKILEMRYGG